MSDYKNGLHMDQDGKLLTEPPDPGSKELFALENGGTCTVDPDGDGVWLNMPTPFGARAHLHCSMPMLEALACHWLERQGLMKFYRVRTTGEPDGQA